jgi:hypothetical protein
MNSNKLLNETEIIEKEINEIKKTVQGMKEELHKGTESLKKKKKIKQKSWK